MKIFSQLQPTEIWNFFEEILKVPRPSGKEEKIRQFLLDFAKKHNLEAKTDSIGNVLIYKPATKGKENVKSVVLQSHIDMVCEKNSNTQFNFDIDAIEAYIDGNWVKAKGTTLGADDGIGIAAQLAVLASKELKHGPIECLFTVDEETGLTGAFNLQPGFITSKTLLNLDSEDEGELFIGCAGGVDTVATIDYKKRKPAQKAIAIKIAISGLTGGHSGDDIHKGLGNSNKILNRFLWILYKQIPYRLNIFDGGNLRNAIPREAYAIIVFHPKYLENYKSIFANYVNDIKSEFVITEPNLMIESSETSKPEFVINKKAQKRLINSLYACPHGVYAMSMDMPGLVETSTNLASVKFTEDNKIQIVTSQRSSVDSAKSDIASMVESVMNLAGAKSIRGSGYPGWKPNTNSEILNQTVTSYKKLFKQEPIVRAIHAGLECGLFLEKYPGMDMISFGPTIKGAHSPDERLDIKTVEKFWDLLVDILESIK